MPFQKSRLSIGPRSLGLAIAALLFVVIDAAGATEHIKIGTLMTTGAGVLCIAVERGYFAAEGIDVEFVPFDAGQPVAVAAVAGDIDFGAAGVTSALYTLAGQGALRIIAGFTYEQPTFHASSVVVSNQAYDAGLRSLKDLAGHSFGLTQIGSSYHYLIAMMAAKHGVQIQMIRVVPLQSLPNVASAIAGSQVDAGLLIAPIALPLVARGAGKTIAWSGDEVSWQVAAIWTAAKTADTRGDTVKRFLRAYRKGTEDYNQAFDAPNGTRQDGPSAPAAYAILAKYLHQTPEQMKVSIGYIDPEDRIDIKDVARQIAWYRSQGMIKGDVDLDRVIDKRYAVAMPDR